MKLALIYPFDYDVREFYDLIDSNRDHLKNLKWAETATYESTLEYVATTKQTEFFRLILVDREIAGAITLRPQKDSLLIGYWVGKQFTRRGVATAAVGRLVNSYLARNNVIYAHIRQTNVKSKSVLTKNGFVEFDFLIGDGDEVWARLVRHPDAR